MGGRRGATLAEVVLGTFIFAVFSLAMLGLLTRSNQLNQQDRQLSQINSLSEGIMEELVMMGRSETGYAALADMPLRPSQDPDYVYAVQVNASNLGLKKVSLLLYYHDAAGSPIAIDTRRPHGGLAVCLGTALEEP